MKLGRKKEMSIIVATLIIVTSTELLIHIPKL